MYTTILGLPELYMMMASTELGNLAPPSSRVSFIQCFFLASVETPCIASEDIGKLRIDRYARQYQDNAQFCVSFLFGMKYLLFYRN